MKRNYIGHVSFALASFLFATTGAFAQSVVDFSVPFAFTVSHTQLPAGHYQIKEDHARQSIKLNNLETGAVILVQVQQDTPQGGARSKAVFHYAGNQYFLSEIRGDASGLDITLPVTSQERKLESMRVASVPQTNPQQIEIALK